MWGVGEEHSIRSASPKGALRPSGKMGVREEGTAGAELWGWAGLNAQAEEKGVGSTECARTGGGKKRGSRVREDREPRSQTTAC